KMEWMMEARGPPGPVSAPRRHAKRGAEQPVRTAVDGEDFDPVDVAVLHVPGAHDHLRATTAEGLHGAPGDRVERGVGAVPRRQAGEREPEDSKAPRLAVRPRVLRTRVLS